MGDYTKLLIAIDGPSASGKSTIGRAVAAKMKLHFFDTGLSYRAVAHQARAQAIPLSNTDQLVDIAQNMKLEVPRQSDGKVREFHIRGINTADLFSDAIDEHASKVAAIPEVRSVLVETQRELTERVRKGIVMVGRDVGTVVLKTSAPYKFYLDAQPEVRAQRRIEQRQDSDYDATLKNIQTRDAADSGREVAPLKPARTALILNTEKQTAEQVAQRMIDHIRETDRQSDILYDKSTIPYLNAIPNPTLNRWLNKIVSYPLRAWRYIDRVVIRASIYYAFYWFGYRPEGFDDMPITRQIHEFGKLTQRKNNIGNYDYPRNARYIYVVNHPGFIETIASLISGPGYKCWGRSRDFKYPAVVNLFETKLIRHFYFLEDYKSPSALLKVTNESLDNGQGIIIAIEGRSNYGIGLRRAEAGIGFLAVSCDPIIIPVNVRYESDWDRYTGWSSLLKRKKWTLTYGKPFRVISSKKRSSPSVVQAISDECMLRIAEMMPSEARGFYRDIPIKYKYTEKV